jgi:hypothetical protein
MSKEEDFLVVLLKLFPFIKKYKNMGFYDENKEIGPIKVKGGRFCSKGFKVVTPLLKMEQDIEGKDIVIAISPHINVQ